MVKRKKARVEREGTPARVMEITPERATQWIEEDIDVRRKLEGTDAGDDPDVRKRGINDGHVEYLAGIMERGEWKLNGETIVRAWDNRMLNGNHRLWAVIASGRTIRSYVVQGVEKGSFVTYDTGWTRGADQALAMKGEQHTRTLAAIARLQFRMDTTGSVISSGMKRRPSNAQVLEVVERYPTLRVAATFAGNRKQRPRMLPGSSLGWLHFAISAKHPVEDVEAFLLKVLEGFGLTETSPILKLRKRLLDNSVSKSSLPPHMLIALTIVAWNAMQQNKRPQYIGWRAEQPWPEIV